MRSPWEIWRIPLALAVLTMFGLLMALLGANSWRWVAWLALLVPIAVGLCCACRHTSSGSGKPFS